MEFDGKGNSSKFLRIFMKSAIHVNLIYESERAFFEKKVRTKRSFDLPNYERKNAIKRETW